MYVCTDDTESNDSPHEGFSDTDSEPGVLATPKECYLWGLLKGRQYSRKNVSIMLVPGRGRSAFAARAFNPGQFVCEYASLLRKTVDPDWGEQRNAELGIGCYCLDATYQGVKYTFDASAHIKDPGRYINHASKNTNLVKMPPVMIDAPPKSRLRIGFVARTRIEEGDELFFNYGVKDSQIPWLKVDAKSIGTTLQDLATNIHTKRPLQDCPVSGCKSVCLRKLADHLRCTHKLGKQEREKYLALAKKVIYKHIVVSYTAYYLSHDKCYLHN